MKKILIFGSIAVALVIVLIWFGKKNSESPIKYETKKPFKATIIKKTVATGNVVPLDEVEIKPQIAGILSEILVQEGTIVKTGDLIATVSVVPNLSALNSANGRIKNAQISFNNAKIQFDRNKNLLQKGVIARQEFENSILNYNNAKQSLSNAKSDRDIIKKGTTKGLGTQANTSVRATTSGMIIEIPVKKGTQVTQANDFNAGTTIARIADMTKMIFEGKVDESEVGKLVKGTKIDIALGAIENKKFPAVLNFIAPKGTDEAGAVQFKIKASVTLDDTYFIRAGYSANAEIVLAKKDSVLSIKEALLQFDEKTEKPYVEVKIGEQEFERKNITLGISDGINVEILDGVTASDELKIWNKITKEEKDFKD
ncbi:efflux RND transporter periplasmic adaptor subunit [Tenacibaculum piscium]|uniref:efflux RND transporter periplasmic adaptor subunit n=1 Tax=Tenacibaculum piscium TaxID=1458515 RepID=UPI001F326EF4|nr:efflux RND transporter periplasmic adaptor subunit [Tenacibaculum piscium]